MESNIKEEWGRTPYGKLQDDWPKDENGDFEEPVFLKHCASTDMEDDLLVNMLAAYPASMAEEARTLCEGEVRNEENV